MAAGHGFTIGDVLGRRNGTLASRMQSDILQRQKKDIIEKTKKCLECKHFLYGNYHDAYRNDNGSLQPRHTPYIEYESLTGTIRETPSGLTLNTSTQPNSWRCGVCKRYPEPRRCMVGNTCGECEVVENKISMMSGKYIDDELIFNTLIRALYPERFWYEQDYPFREDEGGLPFPSPETEVDTEFEELFEID